MNLLLLLFGVVRTWAQAVLTPADLVRVRSVLIDLLYHERETRDRVGQFSHATQESLAKFALLSTSQVEHELAPLVGNTVAETAPYLFPEMLDRITQDLIAVGEAAALMEMP